MKTTRPSRATKPLEAAIRQMMAEHLDKATPTAVAQDLAVKTNEIKHLLAGAQTIRPSTAFRLFLAAGWDYEALARNGVGADPLPARKSWDSRLRERRDLADALESIAMDLHQDTFAFVKARSSSGMTGHLPLIYLIELICCMVRFKELTQASENGASRSGAIVDWLDGRSSSPATLPTWLSLLRTALRDNAMLNVPKMRKSLLNDPLPPS